MGHEVKSLRELVHRPSDPEETGTTFAENARIKAEAFCKASGLPTVADDSGLLRRRPARCAPVCTAPAMPGTTAMTPPTTLSCCTRWPTCPAGQRGAKFVSAGLLYAARWPRTGSGRASARPHRISFAETGDSTALATTRCLCPPVWACPTAPPPRTPPAAAMPN